MTREYDDDNYDWTPPRDEDGRGWEDAYPFEGDEGADRWADEEDEPQAEEGGYDHRELLDQRVTVHCPVAKRCGGCEWLAMPYDMQLERKQDYIEELFADYPVEIGRAHV